MESSDTMPEDKMESSDTIPEDKTDTTAVSNETRHVEEAPLEIIRTISRVPGNPNYHLKNGLRTEGDGYDHNAEFKLTYKLVMAIVGCAMAFTGSQMIPLFYFTLYTSISNSLGATSFIWLAAGSQVGQVAASVSVGPLSDLLGRKGSFVLGVVLSMIGMIVCAATPTASGFIAGQVISGFGLILEELLSIAVISELVPTSKRTLYGAIMITGFIPWAPGALYSQLLANRSWRWVGTLIAAWNLLTLMILLIFYRPPPPVNAKGLSRKEILKRIDFVGMFLGLAGFVLFLAGLLWGGTVYPWSSTHVTVSLGVGLGIIVIFILWEFFGAPYPLFARRLVHVKRTFWCIMFVIFAAGANYVPLAIFWPIESISVFDSGHVRTGINTVPVGVMILGGAIFSAMLCSMFQKKIHLIMTFFCVLQTIGVGCMAAIDRNNINTAWAPLIFGLVGVGGVLFPNQLVVTVITPDDMLATVTSLTFTVRGTSQLIALAILQNRLVAQVTKHAYEYIVPAALTVGIFDEAAILELVQNLTAIPFHEYVPTFLPEVNTVTNYNLLHAACVEAFGKSFPLLYYIGLAFGIAACLASILMGDVSEYMDKHIAVLL